MNPKEIKSTGITGLYKEEFTAPEGVSAGDLNRMMQAATEHAMARLGVDVSDLMERDLLWVICFSQIQVTRMPASGETLEIYSWPGAQKMGMYTRKYAFFTKEGEELLQAASMFSLANQRTREMVLPSEADIIFPEVQMPGEIRLPKMTVKGPDPTDKASHLVTPSEIDSNGHVNNAIYLDWCTGLLSQYASDLAAKTASIWISYAREIRDGEEVNLRYAFCGNRLFVKGYVREEHCFTADMQLA